MIKNSSQKSALTLLTVLTIIVSTTFIISIIARGYIPEYDNGLKIKATGILSATSEPKNANVIINDKLYTTTDNTVNLIPDDYQLKIIKEGYLPWNKKITIQKEMVYLADATLFKTNPKLLPLTTGEIINPTINQNLSQLIYISPPSSTSSKPGIYLIEANYYLSLLLDQYQPKYIAPNPFPYSDKTVNFTFSPNSKQIIIKSNNKKNIYLIDLTQNETNKLITDVTNQIEKIEANWELLSSQMIVNNLNKLPKIFTSTIATNPESIKFSSDDNKFIYVLNNQYFGYDIEKKQNYLIGEKKHLENPFWLPKSNSIIYIKSGDIKSIEFDGTNDNTIFTNSTPIKTIIPQFDGSKLIISTNDTIYNLTIR